MRRVPQPFERRIRHIGEAVLQTEVVQLPRTAHRYSHPFDATDRVHVPGGAFASRQLAVGRRVGEVLGQPIARAQQCQGEVAPRLRVREVERTLAVLEVGSRDPDLDPTVHDIGHVPGERRKQLFVDGDIDVDVGRDLDDGRDVFDDCRDLGRVVRDQRERIRRDLNARCHCYE